MKLYIAEKPSLGRAVASVLGIQKDNKTHVICDNDVIITWAAGHLLEQADPIAYGEKFEIWSWDNLPIFPQNWILLEKESGKKQLAVIKSFLDKADTIVNLGDPDREGDLLINELLDHFNVSQEKRESALRLQVNDYNPHAIQKALDNMEPNSRYYPRSQAALARSRADWLYGMNLSRALTILAKQQGHGALFSFGRCQTPTLALVVTRDAQIANFKPANFFDVMASFNQSGITFETKWQVPTDVSEDKRCLDENIAEAIVLAANGQEATVETYETKRGKSQPPLLFSLLSLQKAMSSQYGYGAQETLDLAQSLYEKHKLTTYPRTDQPYISSDSASDIDTILANLEGLNEGSFSQWVAGCDTTLRSPTWNDKKLKGAAHTAIVPTLRAPDLSQLNEKERNVYLAIASRYIAQFYPAAEDDNTTIELAIGAHRFKTTGKVEVVKGWRTVLGKAKEKEEAQSLPCLEQGQTLTCLNATIAKKKTSPPKPYTEGTLLDAMASIAKEVTNPQYKAILKETAGIGTEATRSGIIEKLKENGYLNVVEKSKSITSTPIGQQLIIGLPKQLRDPAMTAMWEQQLDVIEKGEYTEEQFTAKAKETLAKLLTDFQSGELKFALPASTAPKCPKSGCNGFVLPYKGKRGMAHSCTQCATRFKDNKGKMGKEISKLAKLVTG
ncbi:DNA topoisomerase 3 [Photobacterium damselae]|uniref:DNA topoisomerase 3 n=3 Tax=Photobacterium damselae TaxID=38293 RepID=UPI004068C691